MHKGLSDREKLALYGLVKYPNLPDKEVASKIQMKISTFSSIKQRLREAGYYRTIRIPMLQRLGAELLCVIYTHFNQAVPLEVRVKKTSKTIEVFEEIFYSVGDAFRGFSISLSKDYSHITSIEDIRIETFGQMGLLEEEYPTTVLFPFGMSRVDRFLDYAPLLKSNFELDWLHDEGEGGLEEFDDKEVCELSNTEKLVFCTLVDNPELNDKALGEITTVSRHTISNIRRKFEANGLIKTVRIPSLKLLDFDALSIHHLTYNPSNAPSSELVASEIMDDATIFLCSRRFESFMISAYPDYETAKDEGVKKLGFLKSNDLMTDRVKIEEFSIKSMITIKDMAFGPITRKILEVQKLK